VKQILAERGTIDFWRVRMRPGKPLAFGMIADTPVLGLPGNPVSAAVTFELFGRPALRKMLGCRQLERPTVEVVLEGQDIERADRRHFVRASLRSRGGILAATPTGDQGSHRISSLTGAAALLVILEGEGVVRAGDHVPAILLNDAGMSVGG
jgi:molybdopterin molybdotransferase